MALSGALAVAAWAVVSVVLRPAMFRLAPVAAPRPYNSWVVGDLSIGDPWLVDRQGHQVTGSAVEAVLRQSEGVPRGQFDQWLANAGYTPWASFQPSGRFWIFEAVEALVLLTAVAALLLSTSRLVRRISV
jgi:hypothetical protein